MVYILLKQSTQGKLWRNGKLGTEGYMDWGSDLAGVLCELPRLFGGQVTQQCRI